MSGSSSQPDHAPHLQALLQWIRNNAVQSYDASTGTRQPGGHFVPISAVETKDILGDIFAGLSNNLNRRTVAEKCPRILCILAELGKGKQILEFVRHLNLHDNRLPFDEPKHPPKNFPVSTGDPGWYEAFYRTQWKYCAPELDQETRAQLLDELILPFTALELKGNGNDAWVYRAEVHAKHDKLSDSPPSNHCYALKTFKTRGSGVRYTREATAFEQVTGLGSRDMVGLIAFHSSFEYRDTFNIILEYAEYGNLQEFFEGKTAPTSGDAIIDFWESLFDTAKALFSIHDHFLGSDQNGNRADIQGWHHDLKPTNILVTRTDGRLKYPYSFKIADLGLSRFQHIMEGQPEASGRVVFGTRTYGAPECYASTEHTMHARNNSIKRSSDIWSLGCVYSEAAVWVVKGAKQLPLYKRERGLEIQHLHNTFRDGACFHDGQNVLQAVVNQHEGLRRFLKDDFITGKVIDNMITEMLSPRAVRRPSADQLVGKAESQIRLARMELTRSTFNTPSSAGKAPYMTASQSPGSVSSEGQAYVENRVSVNSAYTNHESVLNEIGRVFQSPVPSRANTTYQYPSAVDILPSDLPGPSDLEEISTPPNKAAWNGTVPGFSQQNAYQPPRPPPRLPPSGFQSGGRSATNQAEVSNHTRVVSSGSAARSKMSMEKAQATPRSKLPECSRDQAKAYYDARKDKKLSAALPDSYLLDGLRDRDHVFMVDDSESMRPFWTDVEQLIMHLAYITKDMDQNKKLELFYLSKGPSEDFKSSKDLANHVKNHVKRGTTSLNQTFDAYLRKYRDKIEKSKRRWTPAALYAVKKCSIYVFTTGILEAGNDEQGQDAIKAVVDDLVKYKLPLDQIGIQFISFGTSEHGLKRLNSLDHLKSTLGLGRDIVDTEPAVGGNVWKMLLGAINAKFDDDAPTRAGPSAIGWTPE